MQQQTIAAVPAIAPERPTSTASRYPRYVVALLGGIALLNALDQSLLGAVMPRIQAEFHLSDTQVGILASSWVLSTVIATLPIGYLADRVARRKVIAFGIAFWSLATLFTGFTRSFPQLLAARSFLGIGEASASPASTSLIGDYFPKRNRGRAMGAMAMGFPIGLGVGLIGGSAIAAHFGWRSAFYVAALPGLLLAALAYLLREPLRGSAEAGGPKVQGPTDAGLRAYLKLFRIPTFVAAAAAATFAQFASAGVFQFVPLYLTRELGLDLARAGAMTGIPVLLGSLAGIPFGAWVVDWRSRRSERALIEVTTIGLVIAAVGSMVAFGTRSSGIFVGGLIVALFAFTTAGLALQVINQNVVVPSLRASAVSLRVVVMNLFGFAMGPLVIGAVSDRVHDLRLTILLLMPTGFLLAALCAAMALRTIGRDVRAMDEQWAARGTELT